MSASTTRREALGAIATAAAIGAAPASAVRPHEAVMRLAITQSGFAERSKLMPDCARAWTEIMSSMKSYVETGKPRPFAWKH